SGQPNGYRSSSPQQRKWVKSRSSSSTTRSMRLALRGRIPDYPDRRRSGYYGRAGQYTHSLVIVSSRFSNSRDTAVHAAAWAGVTPSGNVGGWVGSSAARSHGFASGAENFSACLDRNPSSTSNSFAVGLRPVQLWKAYAARS